MRLKYNFESKKKPVVVASMVRSSLKQNERFGGIHPLVAVASHKAHLPTAIEEVLAKHNGPIDLIAATRGPGALLHADEETQLTNVGMRACLEVGLRQGEALARARGIPFLGVHHMQAHALTPRLLEDGPHPEFPYLSLLVSGGHTLLLLTKSVVRHEILASTLVRTMMRKKKRSSNIKKDIAIGDMLDKLAKTLRIPWGESMPGAALEAYCTDDRTSSAVPGLWPVSDAQRAQWHLTRPLRSKINVDGKRYERMAFSFGGLGSAAERALEGSRHDGERRAIGAETMKVAFEHVAAKVIAALRTMSPIPSTLVVSGGVGRNTFLRHMYCPLIRPGCMED